MRRAMNRISIALAIHSLDSYYEPEKWELHKVSLKNGKKGRLRACLNNRYRAIFGHFQEVLSCFYCCLLRTCRPAGA